jgi:DNA-directed RNA polymerase subunit RPC12/RpoP
MLHFTCPRCKTLCSHTTPGEKVRCPKCGQKVLLPAQPPEDKTLLANWQMPTSTTQPPAALPVSPQPLGYRAVEVSESKPPSQSPTSPSGPSPLPAQEEILETYPADEDEDVPAGPRRDRSEEVPWALPLGRPVPRPGRRWRPVTKPQTRLAIILVLAIGIPAVLVASCCGLGLLTSPVRQASPPNARCPLCGEQFYITYHRGIAQHTRDHTCPNCGAEWPEFLLHP